MYNNFYYNILSGYRNEVVNFTHKSKYTFVRPYDDYCTSLNLFTFKLSFGKYIISYNIYNNIF